MSDDLPYEFEDLDFDYDLDEISIILYNPGEIEERQLEENYREKLSAIFGQSYSEEKEADSFIGSDTPLLSLGVPGVMGTIQLRDRKMRLEEVRERLENLDVEA